MGTSSPPELVGLHLPSIEYRHSIAFPVARGPKLGQSLQPWKDMALQPRTPIGLIHGMAEAARADGGLEGVITDLTIIDLPGSVHGCAPPVTLQLFCLPIVLNKIHSSTRRL